MLDYLLVKFSLERKFKEFIEIKFTDFNNIGIEIDDPVEKEELLNELPEWEINDIGITDDGMINYGIFFEDTIEGKLELERFIKFLQDEFNDIEYFKEHIDNSNWEEEWKKSYTSFEVGNRILVKPTWEEMPETDRIVIEIDPKMAFGTGSHESTSLCMQLMENFDLTDMTVLDLGTGSGILSILAKKLGAKKVDACDIDDIAVDSAIENAKNNNVDINVYKSNLFSNVVGKYDIIIANILAEIIAEMLKESQDYLNDDGILILSGIIQDREDFVIEHLEKNKFELIDIIRKGDWSLITARSENA